MALDDPRRTTTASTLPARSRAPNMNAIDWIALVLMIVGGINWGLVGLLNIDLVAALFGQMTVASRAVYALVGIAALYGIAMAIKQGTRDSAQLA